MTKSILAAAALSLSAAVASTSAQAAPAVKNVVLVHGGFVDGSGWQGVYTLIAHDTIAENMTLTGPFGQFG